LIFLRGFFVAGVFSILYVRRCCFVLLVAKGNKGAKAARHVITHLDVYLSACLLGLTVAALGLGWLGEPSVQTQLRPL
ncbi:CNNM domain-containing protein, partial [Bacillus vallismortis]|nr:CNNM domain-containing protein [Bacillus vallismortis]